MAGFLLHEGATVLCSHGGQATPTVTNSRVTVGGQPTALVSAPWAVSGCLGVPPSVPPCVTAQWISGSTRVTSNGQPLAVETGQAICAPTGTPLIPVTSQTRVSAI
jgi:uncharacterized Zn-binding protein involved in type VI secretion